MPDHRCDKCGERERRRTSTGYPDSSLVSSASPSALGFEDGQASGVNPPSILTRTVLQTPTDSKTFGQTSGFVTPPCGSSGVRGRLPGRSRAGR